MSIALALVAQDGESNPNVLVQFIPFILIGLLMYLFLFRPQKKRRQEMANLVSALGVGDEVVTTSGVYGFITGEDDDLFWLEIDDDVQIRIAKAAVARKVVPKAADGDSDDGDSDDDDASDES
jgi:preprotein translocase subunit YajC